MMHPRAVALRMVESLLEFVLLITLIAAFSAAIAVVQGLPLVIQPLLTVTVVGAAVIPVLVLGLAVSGRQVW